MVFSNLIKSAGFLCLFAFSTAVTAQSQKFRVTLDAGHGGKDFGAMYNTYVEKNIALTVVLKTGKILENTPGIAVTYTRKNDTFIELIERANIANRADSHIFVSVHCNAAPNTAAQGTETFVMGMSKSASNLEAAKRENAVVTMEKDYQQTYEGFDPKRPETMIGVELMQEEFLDNSITLASKIEDKFVALKRRSRGVKQGPFMVLHKAYMPRVLVELGFLSNPTDGAYLDSEAGQDALARALADAIISYKNEYFGSGTIELADGRPSQRINEPAAPPATPEPVRATTPGAADVIPGIVFKVQISASSNKLETTPANFKGLNGVSVMSEGKLFKYYYGQTSDYHTARQKLGEAKEKGFTSAFVVAFRNGKRISLDEALR